MKRRVRGLIAAVVIVAVLAGVYWYARGARQRALLERLPQVDLSDFRPTARRLVEKSIEAVKKDPQLVERWSTLGYALAGNGAPELSVSCFKRCEELDPADERWPYLQAAQVASSDRPAAISALERAIRIHPGADGARAMLAEIHLQMGEDAKAESFLRPRVNADCRDARLLRDLARVEANKGRTEEALSLAKRAAHIAPHRRAIHVLLAQLHGRTKDMANVKRESRLLELLPTSDREGSWPDPTLDQVLLYDRSVEAMAIRAQALRERRRTDEALQLLEELAVEEQSTTHALSAFALAKATRGEFDAALALLDGAPAKEQPRLFNARGMVRLFQGKYEEAAEQFRLAVESGKAEGLRFGDSPEFNRGVCFETLHREEDAIHAFEQALKLNPGNLDAIKRLAALYLKGKRSDKAREILADAELLAPNDPAVRELLRTAGS